MPRTTRRDLAPGPTNSGYLHSFLRSGDNQVDQNQPRTLEVRRRRQSSCLVGPNRHHLLHGFSFGLHVCKLCSQSLQLLVGVNHTPITCPSPCHLSPLVFAKQQGSRNDGSAGQGRCDPVLEQFAFGDLKSSGRAKGQHNLWRNNETCTLPTSWTYAPCHALCLGE